MTYIISICSGKGGTGKTTSAINLSMALKNLGKDVTILDANLTAPNLGVNLGFSKIPITLNDVLKGRTHVTEAVYIHSSGLKLVPASIAIKDLSNLYSEKLQEAFFDLKKHSELIVIDNAPGLNRDVINSMKNSNEVLVVTNPDIASATDALRTIKIAQNLKVPVRGVVLTRVNNTKDELSLKEVEGITGKKVISIVPEDISLRHATKEKNSAISLYPKSRASLAYIKLAHDIIGMKFKEEREEENIGHKVLRFLGFKR